MVRAGGRAATAIVLLLTACQPAKTPAQQAQDDARAVAMVEAAQARNPPPTPLDPETFTGADIVGGQLDPACRFIGAGSPAGNPVVLFDDHVALIKTEARLLALAADPGSPAIGPGIRSHYVGKAQVLAIEREPGSGSHPGEDRLRWPARATVRDAWDQLIYAATGELVCGP